MWALWKILALSCALYLRMAMLLGSAIALATMVIPSPIERLRPMIPTRLDGFLKQWDEQAIQWLPMIAIGACCVVLAVVLSDIRSRGNRDASSSKVAALERELAALTRRMAQMESALAILPGNSTEGSAHHVWP